MESDESDYLLISGLRHFAFCKRRWALVQIEQQWKENDRTAQGHIMHEKAHSGEKEKRGELIITRDVPVSSRRLKIVGKCDVVEWHADPEGILIPTYEGCFSPVPVEYKRGSPIENDSDSLQLCAQAICLEEMLLCSIPFGFLYFGEIRRRQKIEFTDNLRRRIEGLVDEMQRLTARHYTPKAKRTEMCRSCSLYDLCLPELERTGSAEGYIRHMLEVDEG